MVIQTIQQIFQKRFGINFGEEAFSEDLKQGVTRISLHSYQWLYLVKDIETTFGIKIDKYSIESGKIRNLKGLVETIEDLVNNGRKTQC